MTPAATTSLRVVAPAVRDGNRSTPVVAPLAGRLDWLDLTKAVALLWIVLNHLSEQLFGPPLIANPSAEWPPLADRIGQLAPLVGHGVWDLPLNALRYVGWSGDQGVQLFLIASGFGLTWGLLQRGAGRLDLRRFYWARAMRIYPLWWAAHVAFLAVSMVVGYGLSLRDPHFYLSLLGFRAAPGLIYYYAPAWWYVGLLLQLYLVYPLLWAGLRWIGPTRLLLFSCAVALPLRTAGLLVLPVGVDAWARGALFITRLPEFVFGVGLAVWMFRDPAAVDRRLRAPRSVLLAALGYVAATGLSLTLVGMGIAPFLLGVGAFVLVYAALGGMHREAAAASPGMWIGRHSYALYLVHQPILLALVPSGLSAPTASIVSRSVAALLLVVIAALGLEWMAGLPGRLVAGWRSRSGRLWGAGVGLAALTLSLLGAELLIRAVDPQEVLGWGERPSLEPNAQFGWRLRPSQRTHLRWDSYDYYVTANSLGFPGPEYPPHKAPNAVRILVTGDAFTSAEGVDTEQAWPRLLEAEATTRTGGRPVEVLNFAVTGYGPNQYAAVLAQFVPIYRPDVVVVGFSANDFDDVRQSDDEFRASIGFDLPDQDSWRAILELPQLRRVLRRYVGAPAYELLVGRPSPSGYFLGQFTTVERQSPARDAEGRRLVAERLSQIAQITRAAGARLVLAVIPAPVQVCERADLGYYPRNVDLHDAARFDLDLPQRTTQQIADELGIETVDLRSLLSNAPDRCPYQRWNIHWTAAGHRLVADHLTSYLVRTGYLDAAGEKEGSAPRTG